MTTTLSDKDQAQDKPLRLPEWFKSSFGKKKASMSLSKQLEADVPNTICQEAKCPNRSECWSKGLLTFMILGTVCTRTCKFCSVKFGKPFPPDKKDLEHIINAVEKVDLKFVVLTSPNRDDLPDGGAAHYKWIVKEIKSRYPHIRVEVLIPDFKGKTEDLATVISSGADVINHNIETVPSLYRMARKGSLYKRSLELLKTVKEIDSARLTKTGIMLGLGETEDELIATFKDVKTQGVDILTLGQYLKPDRHSLPVKRYYPPEEFDRLKHIATDIGIRYVFSGPLVRSSYLAENVFEDLISSK